MLKCVTNTNLILSLKMATIACLKVASLDAVLSPLHNMKKINCLKHYMPCFPLSLVEYNTCTLLFSSDLSRCCQYGIIYNTSFGSLGPKNTMSICLYILVVDYTENMEICLLPKTQHVGESLRGV